MKISLIAGPLPDIPAAKLIECDQHCYLVSAGRFVLATNEERDLFDIQSTLITGDEVNLFQALWALRGQALQIEADIIPVQAQADTHGIQGAFGALIALLKVAEQLGYNAESAYNYILSIFPSGPVQWYLTEYAS